MTDTHRFRSPGDSQRPHERRWQETILVTGSTDGVGRFVAERLAAEGASVIVHGRDQARGEALVERIEKSGGKVRFLRADLASLADVRALAETVRRETDGLDVLVNNAGISFGGDGARREVSADGFELRFAVIYLAGFLLTRLLLPLIEARAPARIVNVSSAGQQPIDFSDVMLTHGYSGIRAYCQSKLAQVLFTIDLAEELKGSQITVNCLHPATYMDTTMVRLAGAQPISTVEEGGAAILQLVESPALAGRSGLYFNGLRESRADAQAYDANARRQLRALSFKLGGLADPAAA
jgi:NAD(P)-dependent dehydrogenase (short-subunit alcohol dehydrogenase family)